MNKAEASRIEHRDFILAGNALFPYITHYNNTHAVWCIGVRVSPYLSSSRCCFSLHAFQRMAPHVQAMIVEGA